MELEGMRKRLKRNRHALHDQLVNVLKVRTIIPNTRSNFISDLIQTPGDWTYLLNEKGLFS